jgi:hypothetical protein
MPAAIRLFLFLFLSLSFLTRARSETSKHNQDMRSILLKRCVGGDAKVPRDGRGDEGREGRGGGARLAEGTDEDEGASRFTAAKSAGYTLLPQRLWRGSSLPPPVPLPPCRPPPPFPPMFIPLNSGARSHFHAFPQFMPTSSPFGSRHISFRPTLRPKT